MHQDRSTALVPVQGETEKEVAALAPRLRASWQRSRRYGLTPESMRPVFTGAVDTDCLFHACGHEVLRGLRATLANEPVGMMLTDSDGLVLSRLCDDSSVSRSLDRVNLAPGFHFAESNAGTNGLGLALADRAPSLVRADEHYCTSLRQYTCAAAPVVDPVSGELAGSINLTTWSDSSSALLLALAQAAAGNTAALMLARTTGRRTRPAPRGEVVQVFAGRARPAGEALRLSTRWTDAVAEARSAMARGSLLAVVGEPGAGKATLASLARREIKPRERVLCARPPMTDDIDTWLTLWGPELSKDDTCVIAAGVHRLPAWAAEELARLLTGGRQRRDGAAHGRLHPSVITAETYSGIPDALRGLVGGVVEAPALRSRPEDVLPLARHFAHRHRGRPVTFSPAAAQALTNHHWPENARQLRRVVRDAASRTDVVDVRHLPAEVFTGTGRRLTRMQALERDEIVRCLAEPGTTVAQAADRLGMSRATVYRKIAQYDITIPSRSSRPRT
ncbi:helix-turn-helix domain-containing protein [Streptomyces sp. NPDC000348]|uniref:helix-turn-helix domain-containing protein n=1 Tax=Streptomyces sp. NPDC000348 TaxID=3364538 RepID=UPI003677CD5B